jgi:hypothetical protein
MAKVWTIYKFRQQAHLVRFIEAKTEKKAIEIASKEFRVATNRLIARPTK